MSVLDLLPKHLAEKSISQQEIVLPISEALEAVNFLESNGHLILGWEGWLKTNNGLVGHGNAPQGTENLVGSSVSSASEICRKSIKEAAAQWAKENQGSQNELHICITV